MARSSAAQRNQRQRIFYGWVVVFVSFVVLCLAFGTRLSFGIFFEELTRPSAFGWSRGDAAGVFSLSMVVFALGSAPAGWLLDRIGSRWVLGIGVLVLATGLLLCSRMTNLFQFYLFYGVWAGAGITILGLSIHAATISRWFERAGRRGLAIGLAFAGTGIGILVLAPVLERIISAAGWRTGFVVLAVLLIVVALPLTLLLRDTPAQLGLVADGSPAASTEPSSTAPSSASYTWRQAAQTPVFWLLMLAGACSLFTLRMVTVHQVAHFVDKGVPRLTAAGVLGGSGLVTALAFVGFGSLSDRIGRETAFYIGSAAQIAALGLLIGLWRDAPLVVLYGYALLWGIGEGSRSGLLTSIISDRFPGPALGAIVGTLGGFFGTGAALGSWLGGAVYDWSASYVLAFFIALAATVVGSASIFVAQRMETRRHGSGRINHEAHEERHAGTTR